MCGFIVQLVEHRTGIAEVAGPSFEQTTLIWHLQINVDTILFSIRQFDSFFDTTHTVIGVTRAHAQLPHSPIT